jgi:hypothetical protein
MKKVISFSLWSDKAVKHCSSNDYFIGAIKNAKLALKMYPDFECWFYIHKETVPPEIIDKLNDIPNTKIIYKTGDLNKTKPMTWRFESIDHPDVEINLSRDTDTRFLLREKLAVEEWMKSDKIFHIMRDHPHHINRNFPIFAGMFGTKKIKSIKNWKNLLDTYDKKDKFDDQLFLKEQIYPKIINNCLIHTTFGILNNEIISCSKPFPIPYCDNYYFVGGYVFQDDSVSTEHTNILKRCVHARRRH